MKKIVVLLMLVVTVPASFAQQANQTFTPTVGQEGKDVVWVPTPPVLVEKMLDMVNLTPQDYVIDLGSGDGRMVIAAAKRGARSLGVEYNPNMVELSRRNAAEAGVAANAAFVQGDMYQADISKASVMALFLLTTNMNVLKPKFLDLAPGSRIVSNTFGIEGWTPDRTESIPRENCPEAWCTAHLWIVPAKVEGTWQDIQHGPLTLKQDHQMITGTLGNIPISEGRLNGTEISFVVAGAYYRGQVNGNRMEGTISGKEKWSAERTR
jgi:SAM-dependent methyltransferase